MSGSYEIDTAKAYRERAHQLRAIAESDDTDETRSLLLRVVAEYEQMAENMEALADVRARTRH